MSFFLNALDFLEHRRIISMKFEEALQAMREGKKITNSEWAVKEFFYIDYHTKEIRNSKGNDIEAASLNQIIFSEDWEIVDSNND